MFLTVAGASTLPAWQGSPNDQIRLGLIGSGGRGNALLKEVRRSGENAAITAVCDVWRVNREATAAVIEREFGRPPRQWTRYQELLALKDVDAVIIAAPDMTHARILADAIAAGKDAYVEKPFGTELGEARAAYLAVKRSQQVVQVGTNMRSVPGLIGAAQAVHNGAIGKITRVAMEVNFYEPRWRRDYADVKAEDVDWEAFTFSGRIKGGFDARKLRQWQLFRETTNGIPGLWMSHYIDIASWFLRQPYPKTAVASGGVYLWKDGRQTEDVFHALMEYEDCQVGFAMSLTNSAGRRHLWFGQRGTLDAEKFTISGEGSTDPNRVAAQKAIEPVTGESHMANFLRCIRTRGTPRADVQAGFSHAVAGTMAAAALETGRRVGFDPAKLEFV